MKQSRRNLRKKKDGIDNSSHLEREREKKGWLKRELEEKVKDLKIKDNFSSRVLSQR